MTPADLAPGECRPDVSVEVSGTLVYGCQLSSSMCLFTLRLEPEEILDVILKRKDGWEPTTICQQLEHNRDTSIQATGYLERMRPKYDTDSAPLCLHPQKIQIGDESLYVAAPVEKEKDPLASEPTTTIHTATSKESNNNNNNNRGANDFSRFGKFVEFVLLEFGGYEALSQHPVLDVAGGAGGLAFELTIRHEIPTLVVDTRPVKFQGRQKRHLIFRKQCLQRLEEAANQWGNISPVAANLKNRFQIQKLEQLTTLLDSSWVLAEEEEPSLTEPQQKLRTILRHQQCSILLGMHPDQATDPIVDIGLALQIPWAIVPCCVFPNLLQQRKLQTGQPVRTYDDLCQYLRERHPDIQEAVLPFRGRNRVFYWHPP